MDPDTYARADSWHAARRAAGAGLAALDELERLGDGVAFVPVRPPGHHARGDRAMGFCLVNNVAVAAASRTARGERVLIVDWDVHHGNGTQDIFWDDPDVLYVSTHQHPLYPGTGRPGEVGGPTALGLTVNLPLPPGATGDVVRAAIDEVAGRPSRTFAPRLGAGVVWLRRAPGRPAQRAGALERRLRRTGPRCARVRPGPGRLALFLGGGLQRGRAAVVGGGDAGRPYSGCPAVHPHRPTAGPAWRSCARTGRSGCAPSTAATRAEPLTGSPGPVEERDRSAGRRGARARGSARWWRSTR